MKAWEIALTVFLVLLGTGALLNAAGAGKFGSGIQRGASYVTKGYGV